MLIFDISTLLFFMKQILLLLAGTCLATGAYAQKASRMIASSSYSYDGVGYKFTDSTRYTYTGDRGGSINGVPTSLKCDSSIQYNDNAGTLEPKMLSVITYSPQQNPADYTQYIWDAVNLKFKPGAHYVLTYVTINGKEYLTVQATQGWDAVNSVWKNAEKITYLYGNDERPDTLILQSWDAVGNTWKNSRMVRNTYNSANILNEETAYKWDVPAGQWKLDRRDIHQIHSGQKTSTIRQSYNTGTASWDNIIRYLYTYNSAGDIETETVEQWNTGVWLGSTKYISTYNAAGLVETYTTQYWDAGAYKNSSQNAYTYDGSGNQLTELSLSWHTPSSTWRNNARSTYTYNSYNQRTSYKDDTWNAGGFWEYTTSDGASYYYYEEYTLGVEQAKATAGMLNMYPNPATHMLNVNLTWNKPQPFTINVYDMSGRVVYTRNEAAMAQYSRSISLSGLENGNYILMCKGADGAMHQMFTIAK
jgi:hypothetical protein